MVLHQRCIHLYAQFTAQANVMLVVLGAKTSQLSGKHNECRQRIAVRRAACLYQQPVGRWAYSVPCRIAAVCSMHNPYRYYIEVGGTVLQKVEVLLRSYALRALLSIHQVTRST